MADFFEEYSSCSLCPNLCRADRSSGAVGRCRESTDVVLSWAGLHRGEEPPVSGKKGSGMLFFRGCPLHCAYCQNIQISKGGKNAPGKRVSVEQLAELMLSLEEQGAATINMVTGTHFIPSIAAAVKTARRNGLTLDIVWNTSGYENDVGLDLIDPFVDLYLTDIKTLDREVASAFCGLGNYASAVLPAVERMFVRHPKTVLSGGRLRGVLVRHMLFPGTLGATLSFLEWYSKNLNGKAWLSLMVQFTPPAGCDPELFPPVTDTDYQTLLDALDAFSIEDGFVQELADNIPWIPDFTRSVPFPNGFAEVNPLFQSL